MRLLETTVGKSFFTSVVLNENLIYSFLYYFKAKKNYFNFKTIILHFSYVTIYLSVHSALRCTEFCTKYLPILKCRQVFDLANLGKICAFILSILRSHQQEFV